MKRLTLALVLVAVATLLIAENISVATIDVWSGLTYRGVFRVRDYEDRAAREFRYDLLSGGLQQLAPDVIAIQEANPLPAYANRLAEDLSYDRIYSVRQAGVRIGPIGFPTNLREGSVILADRERQLEQLRTKQLTGGGAGDVAAFQFGSASQVVAAQIEVEGRPVYIFTTRWTPSAYVNRDRLVSLVDQYTGDEIEGDELVRLMKDAVQGNERRVREAEQTLVFINEMAGENPVILMGSFHSLPSSQEIAILTAAGFVDVWQSVGRGVGHTYDAPGNSNITAYDMMSQAPSSRERIDYIFVRGAGIAARSAQIIFSRPTYGVHPSDHYGIYAELRIDPQ